MEIPEVWQFVSGPEVDLTEAALVIAVPSETNTGIRFSRCRKNHYDASWHQQTEGDLPCDAI